MIEALHGAHVAATNLISPTIKVVSARHWSRSSQPVSRWDTIIDHRRASFTMKGVRCTCSAYWRTTAIGTNVDDLVSRGSPPWIRF